MNIIKNITIDLTEKDIKEIVAGYVGDKLRNDNVTAEDVKFNITTVETGPQMHPCIRHCLKGATVKCKM